MYLVACTAAFAVSSPVGENIARLRFVAAPIAILTLSLRRWQPRSVCVVALALALSWNLTPLAASFVDGVDDPAAHAGVLVADDHVPASVTCRPSYRVEAVDTAGHWPADFLARARIPLARGWFRQEDFPQNRVLYGEFGAKAYVRLAAPGQRSLRRPHLGTSGLQLARGGATAGERPLRIEARRTGRRRRRSSTSPLRAR